MADTELIELIRNASPDYPVYSVKIIEAMRANPDVVLRALGGKFQEDYPESNVETWIMPRTGDE